MELHPPGTGACADQEHLTAEIKRVTLIGLVLNLALTIFKMVAGVLGASQAVVADGIHSLSDSATDVAVIIGASYWAKPPDEDHPFGHRRVETVVASLIGFSLAGVGVFLGYRSLHTIQEMHSQAPGLPALIAALLSMIIKEWLYRWTKRVGHRLKSPALLANAWHHRSDAFSSVPVAIAVAVSIWLPAWAFLDHVAAVMVAIFILQAAWRIIYPLLNELIDKGADERELEKIREVLLSTEGVRSVHAIRSRYLGSGLILDLHLMVDGHLTVHEGHEIAGIAKSRLLREGDLGLIDVLIHIEPYSPLAH
jgi:cation diffusion facilitator family transporter